MAIENFNGFKINLTQSEYDELKSTGVITKNGSVITFDENTIYHVYDSTGAELNSGSGINISASGESITISVSDDVAQINKTNVFSGPQTVNGDLTVSGNIYQNGETYETHAEKIYSKNDYIVLRENATNSLGNEYSGIQIIKYNGTDDLRLVVGADGIARVGKIGDEQPLATREESPIANGFAYWDSENNRFNTQDLTGRISPNTDLIYFESNNIYSYSTSSKNVYTKITGASIRINASSNTTEFLTINGFGITFPKSDNLFGQNLNDAYGYKFALYDVAPTGIGALANISGYAYRYSMKDLIPAESNTRIAQRVNDSYYRSINDLIVICNEETEENEYKLGHIYKISVDKTSKPYVWSSTDITPSGFSPTSIDISGGA